MTTLILPARYTEDSILMWQAARKLGWRVHRLQAWRVDSETPADDVVVYGEPLFAATVADQLGLALLEPPFDWLSGLPPAHLKREVRFLTLSGVGGLAFPVFLKPADDKCFPARVYGSPELPGRELLPDSTPVLASEPVSWTIEVRAFILHRRLETLSVYARHGELAEAADGSWPMSESEEDRSRDFLTELLGDSAVQLPPAVVIDVGEIPGRGWAVIEANASWSSGLYGCDPLAVLGTLRHACKPSVQLDEHDRPWVVSRSIDRS